jgi:hypothetical protein
MRITLTLDPIETNNFVLAKVRLGVGFVPDAIVARELLMVRVGALLAPTVKRKGKK